MNILGRLCQDYPGAYVVFVSVLYLLVSKVWGDYSPLFFNEKNIDYWLPICYYNYRKRKEMHQEGKKMDEIKILMENGSTRSEAEKHLKNGTIIFDEQDLKDNFDFYMDERCVEDEEKEKYRKMLETHEPVADWGVVENDGTYYYIEYVL